MKYSYRITKYENLTGVPSRSSDEWTSFHDIGKKVSRDEYLSIEMAYVEVVKSICNCLGVSFLTIRNLEMNTAGIIYKEAQVIPVEQLPSVVKAVLREEIWCKLIAPRFQFHFGWDYYMYLVSDIDVAGCFSTVNHSLYVEEFRSPYFDF